MIVAVVVNRPVSTGIDNKFVVVRIDVVVVVVVVVVVAHLRQPLQDLEKVAHLRLHRRKRN